MYLIVVKYEFFIVEVTKIVEKWNEEIFYFEVTKLNKRIEL